MVSLGLPVRGLEGSSLNECATLDRTNVKCSNQYESCAYYKVKKASKPSDRDQYNFGCILTKWCNTDGTYKGVYTHFTCPYGRKDAELAAARKSLSTETAKKAIDQSEQYLGHRFGQECEEKSSEYVIPGAEMSGNCLKRKAVIPKQASNMHSGKYLRYEFGVRTVLDRFERDGWLLL